MILSPDLAIDTKRSVRPRTWPNSNAHVHETGQDLNKSETPGAIVFSRLQDTQAVTFVLFQGRHVTLSSNNSPEVLAAAQMRAFPVTFQKQGQNTPAGAPFRLQGFKSSLHMAPLERDMACNFDACQQSTLTALNPRAICSLQRVRKISMEGSWFSFNMNHPTRPGWRGGLEAAPCSSGLVPELLFVPRPVGLIISSGGMRPIDLVSRKWIGSGTRLS